MGARAKVGVAGRVSLLIAALAAALILFPATAGAVVPELLTQVPEDGQSGSGANQLFNASGIAADPNLPGHVYVADEGNNRIDVFSPWGEFLYAFGWHVNAFSPEEKLQKCTVATGCLKGSEGGGAGQLNHPEAVAVDGEGNVFVIDRGLHRIQKFGSGGEFLYAAGGDTVAHGPDDSTNNEVQQLSVAASTGTFKLGFENPLTGGGKQETASLPFNAGAAEVKAALNALSTIGGLGGSVSVTGGPGNATGSTPYTITFEGNLGGDNVPQLSIDRSGLGIASIGGTLRCSLPTEAETYEYRWLRNGVEIPGAESPSYTTVAADEGKSVQCQVRVASGNGGVIQAATLAYVAPPEGGTPPPVAPEVVPGSTKFVAEVDGSTVEPGVVALTVGGGGGEKLICNTSEWTGPISLAYGWYRNGVRIPGATESTYVVTEEDLATPAFFQCKVTASNAGTATTTEFSVSRISLESLTLLPPRPVPPNGLPVEMDPPSNVFTASQGGAPEVCKAADTCKAGIVRHTGGWLGAKGHRAMLAASPVDGTIFAGEDKNEYTGEPPHIQAFDSDGTYRETIELPEETNVKFKALAADGEGNLYAGLVASHLRDGAYPVYEPTIRKLESSGPSAHFLTPAFVLPPINRNLYSPDGSMDDPSLYGIAVDAAGNVYADTEGDTQAFQGQPGVDRGSKVFEFDPKGNCLDCGTAGERGRPGFDRDAELEDPQVSRQRFTLGIGTGGACGSTDIYILHLVNSSTFFNVFGPHPEPALCPPPEVPPTISNQHAASVGTEDAVLKASINPHFWADTRYYLEYGTAPCSLGGCQAKPAAPGRVLTTQVVAAKLNIPALVLSGLEPNTTYHYRFVAQSSGGGPVRGPGGTLAEDGPEGTFTTFAPEAPGTSCPNQALRAGPSAQLPDCRAYEMVSPIDKESGDVLPPREGFLEVPAVAEQSSVPGPGEPQRLAYGSYRAFGDAQSGAWTSQYLATRGEEGWRSENITPPHGRANSIVLGTDTELKALSPDLCHSWWRTAAAPQLAPNAVLEQPNVYRRDEAECGSGEGQWEAFTTLDPPHTLRDLELQGTSEDGGAAIYATLDSLPTPAPAPAAQDPRCYVVGETGGCRSELYYQEAGEGNPHYVCVLPDGSAIAGACSAGTGNAIGTNRLNSLWHAISADGSRVYWTASAQDRGAGSIYVRENPGRPESAHLHGVASGTGDLIGPASGTGKLIIGSKTVTEVTGSGFAAGQAISGTGIPNGTTIASVNAESHTMKLSAAASASGTKVELIGQASATVSHVATITGAFAVGQEISAANGGIAPGTTITKVEGPTEGLFTLTLSAKATESAGAVALSATSECTEAAKACTLPVSAEGEALSHALGASEYVTAARDGSRAFFSVAAAGNISTLYEYDRGEEKARRIAGRYLGLTGASEDASRIYFASEEVLAGPNPEGEEPEADKPNLYLYDAGLPEGERYRFVARLAANDKGSIFSPASAEEPLHSASRVSPDGLHAAFMTKASPATAAFPAGYDNADVANGGADAEVYLYDAAANGGEGGLLCASCNPGGARPAGENLGTPGVPVWVAAQLPVWENDLYASRVLSEDGNRLFFMSFDALSPRDTNGVKDVYQWEAAGTGSCEEGNPDHHPANGGCVDLISSGHSSFASRFVDANPSGEDVFIATAQSLDPADTGLLDIYDVRVEGGFPPPASKPAACEGEACQGTPEAPNDPTPASESFEGAGNVREEAAVQRPKPCAKGKVKRKGHCVAKHKAKKRHAKRNRRAGR